MKISVWLCKACADHNSSQSREFERTTWPSSITWHTSTSQIRNSIESFKSTGTWFQSTSRRNNETNRCLLFTSMNLKIHQRESQDDDNLFVRLHPSTIRKLCVTASHRPTLARGSGDIRSSWIIHDELLNDVQFLPLRIKASDDKWIYCSYNGGFCSKGELVHVDQRNESNLVHIPIHINCTSNADE